jgi:hypothetical protein
LNVLAPEWLEKWPLLFLIENVCAKNQIESLVQTILLPVQPPGADSFAPEKAVERRKQQRVRLQISKEHIGPQRRRHRAGQAHSTTKIQHIFPHHQLRRAHQQPSNAQPAFPQLRPVGQMQFLSLAPLAADFFPPILLGRNPIEHHVRIGDAREGKLQRADLQCL